VIWRVEGEQSFYIPIYGVRSFDRSQKHRAELDLTYEDREETGVPMRFPVVFCHLLFPVDPKRQFNSRLIGRFSEPLMERVRIMRMREAASRKFEHDRAYRQPTTGRMAILAA
jgi:hypothetical protein